MATFQLLLTCIVALPLLLHTSQAQQGVCYSTLSQQQAYTAYSRQSYFYYINCGYFSRCIRYAYRQQLVTLYRTNYYSQRHCCAGYQSCSCQSCTIGCQLCNSGCCPICNDCGTNETCSAPFTCGCPAGWTGHDCNTDIDECTDPQLNYTQLSYTRLNDTQFNDTELNEAQRNDTQLCEQTCTNTLGSYNCSCGSDYNLANDLHSCLAMPENITFNATSSRSMILSWDPPGHNLRNGIIQSYSVCCSSDDHVGFVFQQTITASSQSVSMTGLNPFTSYNCCVATITTNGNGPYSCDSGSTLKGADCGPPAAPQNGSLESYTDTTEGSEVFYSCDPRHVPVGRMRAVCTENGWSPNPPELNCTVVDCGPPVAPQNGYLESYTHTAEGAEVFYSCDPGHVPQERMRAVCTENGWTPNPVDLRCTGDCGPPVAPQNGSLESYTDTTEGSEVFYSCDPGLVPERRVKSVCAGNEWSPNPTDLSCTVVSPSTAANTYYIGFCRGPGLLTLYITTTESVPVSFNVSSSTGQIYSGIATNSEVSQVTFSSSLAVLNNNERNKGVWIHATDSITVDGINNAPNTADGFVALPCYDFEKQNYIFYAVSTHYNRTSGNSSDSSEIHLMSQVLLVGCKDNTELAITPTQTIEIPSDLARGSNTSVTVPSGMSYTITLNRLQTFLFTSTLDLTGSKVVSNKPIAFFSGHECADVPVGVAACDYLVEQLPPTLTWGRQFFVVSSLGKTAGEQYKLITSAATTTVICYCYTSGGTVSQTFTITLNETGRSYEFHIGQNMFCSVQASSPILLVQFAIGGSREPLGYGDPFMMMIPPVEQYSNNYTFVTQSGFQNAITITVTSGFFNPGNIVLNGTSLGTATWTPIYCSVQTDSVCGFGTRISISTGRNFIYHREPTAKLGTFVYGFSHGAGYGYPAGMQLFPIPADCGPPAAPNNGSVESYTDTTEGSEVFYSCHPGHFPQGRMRTVCTENGWSPNTAELNCTVADCGLPVAPRNGSLVNYTGTTHGSEVIYICDPGHVPEGRMRVVCTENGWSPNLDDLNCTEGVPTIASLETLSSTDTGAVIGGSIASVIAMLFPIIACLIYYRRRKRRKPSAMRMRPINPKVPHTYVGDVKVEMQQFDKHRAKEKLSEEATRYLRDFPGEMIFHRSNLHLLETIGQGEFGIVYRARLTRPTLKKTECEIVAVKTIKGFLDSSDTADFLKECLKMKAFVHPHVMGILGICLDGHAPYVVMPFMANGSLHTYLRKHRMELLISEREDTDLICKTQKRLLDMCLQIAKGMEYLTGQNLVHRDLAARNCMLDQNYLIKVADFGLSENTYTKDYFRQEQTAGTKLPIKWMAYESLTDGIFSEKTDVWSFGVTCWEIFTTAKTPYPGIHPTSLIAQLENGERLPKPNNAACCDSMYEVMRSCWDADPQQRPAFSQLVATITSLLTSLADYLDVSTFVTEEQDTIVTESQVVKNENCDEEASQERHQTAQTHFQGGYVLENEGAEEHAK